MPAAIHHITIEAGATFRLEVTWKDSNEVPVNLSAYTAEAQVREGAKSGNALLTFSSADDSIQLGEDGQITLLATPEQTRVVQGVVNREGIWDLELTNGAGEVTRLLKGKARFSGEVTR